MLSDRFLEQGTFTHVCIIMGAGIIIKVISFISFPQGAVVGRAPWGCFCLVRAHACVRVCVCVCAGACARACVRACAGAPADGMTHLDWAVLYSGVRACYIRLRSGWGSDGKVYNVLRGLDGF